MKKIVIILTVLLITFSVFSSTLISSNEVCLSITGNMPRTYDFVITPKTFVSIDLLGDSGSQIPIATYLFSSNSVSETSLKVYPKDGNFNIVDNGTGAKYDYQVAVCTYDELGNVNSVTQFGNARTIPIDPPVVGEAEEGEIFACLNYNTFNEIPSGNYSSELYFEVTTP